MKKPPCWAAGLVAPKERAYYFARIFDPVLMKERIASVTSRGMTQAREVRIGIDRVDRWGRVTGCCAGHAREDFANDRRVMWYS